MTAADEYVPTTEEVGQRWSVGWVTSGRGAVFSADAFDRWLAAHDAQVAARAWDEGFEAAYSQSRDWGHPDGWETWPQNPNRIERRNT